MSGATCKSCGAPIRWAKSSKGKPMPIDRTPVEGGNLILELGDDGEAVARVVQPQPGVRRFQSHHASCPHAAQWRKGKR